MTRAAAWPKALNVTGAGVAQPLLLRQLKRIARNESLAAQKEGL